MGNDRRRCTQETDRGAPAAGAHIVFQVAVHFPRHVDREELATGRGPGVGRGGPPLRRVRGRAVRPLRGAAHPRRDPRCRSRRRLGAPLGAHAGPPARGGRAAPRHRAGPGADRRGDRRGARHDPRRAGPPPGPPVPLRRPGPRARGQRRRRRPHPGRRARATVERSSRPRSSRTASCTPTCVTPSSCCPSATAW